MNSSLIQHFNESINAKESLLKQKKVISKAKQKIYNSIIKKKDFFLWQWGFSFRCTTSNCRAIN